MARITAQTSLVLGDSKTAATRADAAVKIAAEAAKPGAPPSAELLDAMKTRSVARWYSGDFPGAVADAEEVLKTLPKDPVATAVAKLAVDRVPSQIQITKGPGMEPNLPELVNLAGGSAEGEAEKKAKLAEAVRYLKQGEQAMQQGDYQDMHRLATTALKVVPENPRAYMQRAFADLFLKRYTQMVADTTMGLALEPGSPELMGLRARGYNELGNYEAAFQDAEKALLMNPKHAMPWMERARAREGLQQPAEAWLRDFKQAAELRPEWSHFYDAARG